MTIFKEVYFCNSESELEEITNVLKNAGIEFSVNKKDDDESPDSFKYSVSVPEEKIDAALDLLEKIENETPDSTDIQKEVPPKTENHSKQIIAALVTVLCGLIFVAAYKIGIKIYSNVKPRQTYSVSEKITPEVPKKQEEKKPVEKVYRFVNTLDGINLRKNPDGEKIAKLQWNEKVEILETGKYAEINNFRDNWYKIRTKNGKEGFAYGAYLSDTLEKAARFRCREQLDKCQKWFEKIENKFRGIGIDIDEYPYNIVTYYEDGGEKVSPLRRIPLFGTDFDFWFYPTCKKESDGKGESYFLYEVKVIKNDDFFYPDFLPFRIGDKIEDVYTIFGKPTTEYSDGYWWANGAQDILMSIGADSETGRIQSITLRKSGW